MRNLTWILLLLTTSPFCFGQQQDSTKKQWLGVLTLTEKYKNVKNWTKEDETVTGQHFQRLVKLKNEGIVLLAGRTNYETDNPDMMGIIIFYAPDDKAARQFMLDDPAVKGHIMLAKVHPYSIAISKCDP